MARLQATTPGLEELLTSAVGAGLIGGAHGYAHTRFGQAQSLAPAAVGTTGKVVVGTAFASLLAAQSLSFT